MWILYHFSPRYWLWKTKKLLFSPYCYFSVAKSCQNLCNPMDCSILVSSVLHYVPEYSQIHIHWVGDAIQSSHPLSSPSPLAFHLSQHQGFLHWVSSLHQVAKYWSLSFRISPSNEYSGLISFKMDWLDLLVFKGLSRVFSNTIVQKHQFFCSQLSL